MFSLIEILQPKDLEAITKILRTENPKGHCNPIKCMKCLFSKFTSVWASCRFLAFQ